MMSPVGKTMILVPGRTNADAEEIIGDARALASGSVILVGVAPVCASWPATYDMVSEDRLVLDAVPNVGLTTAIEIAGIIRTRRSALIDVGQYRDQGASQPVQTYSVSLEKTRLLLICPIF